MKSLVCSQCGSVKIKIVNEALKLVKCEHCETTFFLTHNTEPLLSSGKKKNTGFYIVSNNHKMKYMDERK
jgi:hypothetical protein